MGPIFFKNIPKHGFCFSKISKIFGCWHGKHLKMLNVPRFQEKSLKMGTFSCQSDPWEWAWVSRLERHTHVQTKFEYPLGMNPVIQ